MIKRGIFKANDIRGITEGLDPEWDASGAYAIGAAAVDVLDLHSGAGALVVGRDMRLSGPLMVPKRLPDWPPDETARAPRPRPRSAGGQEP